MKPMSIGRRWIGRVLALAFFASVAFVVTADDGGAVVRMVYLIAPVPLPRWPSSSLT